MNDAIVIVDKKSVKEDLRKHGIKFARWAEAFFNKESKTYGNASKSAMEVYNCKKYNTARVIASQNLTKLNSIGLAFAENEGRGAEFWFKVLETKALKGSYEQSIDYMQRIGILEKDTSVPQNQINQQFNLGDIASAFTQARKTRGLDQTPPHSTTTDATGSVPADTTNNNN